MSRAVVSACVLWTGATHEGYPMISDRRAHRVAYEATHGAIPPGHVIHDTCDTKLCVNPDHLEAMTPRVHMLLHRSWEASHARWIGRTECKYGHPLDGTKRVHGRVRPYCRTCHSADCKRRAAVRRLSAFLPQSPQYAGALAADERPAPLLLDDGPIAGLAESAAGMPDADGAA